MLFLSLSGILLYGESSAVLSVSSSGFYLKVEELLFDMRYGKPSFSYKGFSYGDISRRGLFRTLSNPHQSTSLRAEALPFRKYNSTAGSIFTFSDFDIFYVSSPRTSAGFSFGRGNFELAYAYIGKAERKYKLQKDFMNDIDTSLMFGGIKYKHRYFSVLALGSFDSYGSFSGLLGTRVSYNGYSIEARLGNLLPIKNRTSYDRLSINTAIENEDVYISWQCSFGNKPIYSYEYMEKECKKEVTLKLDHINIIAFSSYSFSRKGVARYTSSL